MNKILALFIALNLLCGCAAKINKVKHKKVATINIDRKDVIVVPRVPYNEKFRVVPVDYRVLLASNSVNLKGYKSSNGESCANNENLNVHEKWLNKMRAQALDIENQINGVIKSNGFDIKNIPIGVSYKFELDKPRKKSKNCSGR